MSTARDNENGNTVTLDLRVSCDTFGKYQMKYKIDRDKYHDPKTIHISEHVLDMNKKRPCFQAWKEICVMQ